ncbi:hypothetical protein COHA_001389 [Chlorella ohadii]|uniref:Calcium load-activated calcium channel n=1 Tax=Chlorella ohadii TaxID=2649997 RepID=A0AAD5DYW3_9CHLO|nr:hypothetical protein COHA_001389 [Chlorella ohadii]
MSLVPLAVIGFCAVVAAVGELLQWFFVWRTPAFQALKANLAKHVQKVEEAKEASGSAGPKNVRKKEQRLEQWQRTAGQQIAKFNMRAGLIMMVHMFVTYRVMTRVFGGMGPACRLPFEPPPFLQKVTHRGLEGADVREGSVLFIFILCQSSLRLIIQKALNLGMGREFQDILPAMPKGAPFASFFNPDDSSSKKKK